MPNITNFMSLHLEVPQDPPSFILYLLKQFFFFALLTFWTSNPRLAQMFSLTVPA